MAMRPVHPLLLGAYPALFVFAHNRAQLGGEVLALPMLAGIGLAALVWAACFARLRDARLSAAASAPLLIAFFGYGICESVIAPEWLISTRAGRLCLAAGLLLLAVLVQQILIRRLRADAAALRAWTAALNGLAGALLVLPLGQLAIGAGGPGPAAGPMRTAPQDAIRLPPERRRPDIYYIVLDGYGAEPVLRRIYDYDARPFLGALETLGFEIVLAGRANYPRTVHAMASALNFAYLSADAGRLAEVENGLGPLVHAIQRNKLMHWLAAAGYTTWAFESGYEATELRDADHYLRAGGGLGEYSRAVLAWTPLPALLEWGARGPYALHRDRVRAVLAGLPRVAKAPGPKLVFAHLLVPHPPFVFDAKGNDLESGRPFALYDGNHYLSRESRADYIAGYRAQIAYVSDAVLAAIEGILAASKAPPIIVLQGDHGPGLGFHHADVERSDLVERMSILSAIHWPDPPPESRFAPGITPVNVLRTILATLFAGTPRADALAPLPDRSFYTTDERPYDFVDVTARLDRAAAH